MMKKKLAIGAAVLAALVLSACSSGNPLSSGSPNPGASGSASSITIGSANFPENELLAQIYAGALTAKGVTVTTKLNIASRETYVPALKNGEIDLIPEYTGAFAKYLDPNADISNDAAALASLKAALPSTLTALNPAPAQDKDSITVTRPRPRNTT